MDQLGWMLGTVMTQCSTQDSIALESCSGPGSSLLEKGQSMTPWHLALLARTVLILPPLSQHLTFPLLSVTLLVSFGSSMLYGYNLAVVNSPAEVRDGQPLWEQGKQPCIPPLERGGTAVQQPHIKTLALSLSSPPERNGMGRTSESMFMYSKLVPLEKQGLESWPQPPCSSLSALFGISNPSLGLSGAENC